MPRRPTVRRPTGPRLRDIRGGVAAEATVDQIATSVKAKAGAKDTPDLDMTTGAVVMKGLDLGLWARFVFDKAQPATRSR